MDGVEELAEYGVIPGNQEARYDHDPSRVDGVLAQVAGAKSQAVTDVLGSVYGLTDTTGTAVTRYNYDAYGARSAGAEAVPTSWGFTGRKRDQATALQYARSRYYAPEVGSFISRDPLTSVIQTFRGVSAPSGGRDFLYAAQRPTMLVDPLGLSEREVEETKGWVVNHFASYATGLIVIRDDPGAARAGRSAGIITAGVIWVDPYYFDAAILSCRERADLASLIYHEVVHVDAMLAQQMDGINMMALSSLLVSATLAAKFSSDVAFLSAATKNVFSGFWA